MSVPAATSPDPRRDETLLDELLPDWHVRTRHAVAVEASSGETLAAVRETTLAEMPLGRVLFRLRGLRASGERPVFAALDGSFQLLAEQPGREIVYGGIGRPWTPRGGAHHADDFRSFAEPGWAKLALAFRAEAGVLTTETRVWLTDEAARRSFRRYWLVVRPFSGLVRQSWLSAVKRRAERRARRAT